MLRYRLYDNHFTAENSDDCLARPVDVSVKTREELIEAITGPGSILKPTEVNAVIDSYWSAITEYIRRGEGYRDDYIYTRYAIRGVFYGDEDQFDPKRHQVVFSVVPKNSITRGAEDVTLQKVDGQDILPHIENIYDWGSRTNGDILTPDGVLEISGDNLKIYNNLEVEGVFFVSEFNEYEFKSPEIRINEPKRLTLRIPEALTGGTYRLEVRTTPRNGNRLRTGIFAPELTVT